MTSAEPFHVLIEAHGDVPDDDEERAVAMADAIAGGALALANHTAIDPCEMCGRVINSILEMMIKNGHGGCAVKLLEMASIKMAKLTRERGVPLNG